MKNDSINSQVLDLTDAQTLFELAIDAQELLGQKGAKLIADLKEKAGEADYTHMYFRDPMRPGIVWFAALANDGISIPTRGKLDEAHAITDKVFPGFILGLDPQDEDGIMAQIPPLTTNASGLELVTALEYIIFLYPEMVRAWAALIFAYGEMLNLEQSAKLVYQDCAGTCKHAQIVAHLLPNEMIEPDGDTFEDDSDDQTLI